MAGQSQQGFVYEKNVATYLKKFGHVPKNFVPAGSGSDKPDLILQRGKLTAGCELKLSAASAGSIVLRHENGKWKFNDTDNDPEKAFLVAIANQVKIFDKIKRQWKATPLKRYPVDAKLKAQMGKMTKEQIYKRDLANFPDIKGEISASTIAKYYQKKDTYYVNVGTHGFYLFGTRDPLGYNESLLKAGMQRIPQFGTKAKAIFRARVQYKGSGQYQFTFEIQFSIVSSNRSPYNIGADGKSPVISKTKTNISCLEG